MLQLIKCLYFLVDRSAGLHGIAVQDVANTLMIFSFEQMALRQSGVIKFINILSFLNNWSNGQGILLWLWL